MALQEAKIKDMKAKLYMNEGSEKRLLIMYYLYCENCEYGNLL